MAQWGLSKMQMMFYNRTLSVPTQWLHEKQIFKCFMSFILAVCRFVYVERIFATTRNEDWAKEKKER